jgi:hypothetical protein
MDRYLLLIIRSDFSTIRHMDGARRFLKFGETASSFKSMESVLPKLLQQIEETYQNRPDLIVSAWPLIVKEEWAKMTRATGFQDGVLFVDVKNSALYSQLAQYEKGRLLISLRNRFPDVEIRNLIFRIG